MYVSNAYGCKPIAYRFAKCLNQYHHTAAEDGANIRKAKPIDDRLRGIDTELGCTGDPKTEFLDMVVI